MGVILLAQFTASDAVLISVVARELQALAAGSEARAAQSLQMAAALLEALDLGTRPPPAANRGLDLEALKARLCTAGLAGADTVLRADRSLGGYSKDTFLVALSGDGGERGIVVRRDVPAGTTRTSVAEEYEVLKPLAAAGFPVAEPLLVEPSHDVLGQPFMVTRRMQGEPEFTAWQTDREARRAGAHELARLLARLHRFDMPSDGPAPPLRDAARIHIEHWLAFWRECRPRAGFDEIDRAYDWILDHLTRDEAPAALVHGDVGFHNILMDGSRISAMLDWEFAHAGDPAEDLSYCRPSIEELTSWDDFITAYRAAGGPDMPEERLNAYEIWRGVRNATCCAIGVVSFDSGRNTDLRLAFAGRILIQRFARDVEQQLQRFA